MKCKRFGAMLLAIVMCIGMFSTTAFAYVDESVAEEPEETAEEVVLEEPEPMEPLTPDGNLTLVDDEGSSTDVGKQFITVVTKTGNYFYLIIDRDDKGDQTVHFLNQVDEADLLKLMDEKESAQYESAEKAMVPEVVPEPETEPVKTEPEEPKANVLPVIGLLLVLAIGGGAFVFVKMKDKKKAEQESKPDPDADYVDDEEDYGFEELEDYEDTEEDVEDDEPV